MEAAETSRTRRGRPSSLTHDRIIEAVLLRVGDRRLEDVSMREVADQLGVPVMTLYNYVANKEELAALVVDHILRPVRVPDEDAGPWHERIRSLERQTRHAMSPYRGISIRSSVRSAEAMRLAEGVQSILTASGFNQDDANRAFATLYTFMLGQIEVDFLVNTAQGGGEPNYENATGRGALSRDELFEFGFDAVLTGLDLALRNKQPDDT